MIFAEKLKLLRKQQGWSQEELAARIPISRQAVSKWESGTAMPDTENVLALADLFGVFTDYLLREDCVSEDDTPTVRSREENSRVAWAVCVGMQYLGLFLLLAGEVLYSIWLLLPALTMQIAGMIGFEASCGRYHQSPGTADIRRKFYRISVWAFALFPCQFLCGLPLQVIFGAWLHLPAIYLLGIWFLYLTVCLAVTWLLRPKIRK